MKIETTLCDMCKKRTAVGKCEICKKDNCWELECSEFRNISFGGKKLGEIRICSACYKRFFEGKNGEEEPHKALKKKFIDYIKRTIMLKGLKNKEK